MEDRKGPSDPKKGDIAMDRESQAMHMLKDLALKWFMETQAPLILQNGTLPEWFHGFITRKQAEELLGDKPIGCFLIRLSDRAIGYILSYRGYNRCRHFVINQLQNRKYLISGDTCDHPTLTALISYYQEAKIEPFGETLTTACPRPKEDSLYDAISMNQMLVTPPTSSSTFMEKQELEDLEYLRSAKGRDLETSPTPKPKTSFLHSKKSLEECPWKLSEEDNDLPVEAPPLPERSSSLLLESFSGRTQENIVYAELKRMNHKQKSLSTETTDIPHLTLTPGTELHRSRNPSGEESAPQTRDALIAIPPNAAKLLGINLDHNKKSPTVPRHPMFEHTSPLPISTSPVDKGSRSSSPNHQAFPKAQNSPESIGSGHGSAIYDILQTFRGSASNKPRSSSPPGTYDLMSKRNSSSSLEGQIQDPGNHDYEPIPARLPKSAFLSLTTTNDELESHGDCMDNTYERIPGNQAASLPSLPTNPYEQIPNLKVPETKHTNSHKVEKHRRFFFTDRKNKH